MEPNHKELTAADYAAIFKAKRHQKFNRKERLELLQNKYNSV